MSSSLFLIIYLVDLLTNAEILPAGLYLSSYLTISQFLISLGILSFLDRYDLIHVILGVLSKPLTVSSGYIC